MARLRVSPTLEPKIDARSMHIETPREYAGEELRSRALHHCTWMTRREQRMNKARTMWTVAVMVVVAAAMALAAGASLADIEGPVETFSKRTIKGNWGFVTTVGSLLPPAVPAAVATAGVGSIHFDGDGGCTVTSTTNVDGHLATFHSSICHYSVNADGTGTSEAVFPDSPIAEPMPVAFVIVERGREIMFTYAKFIIGTFVARRR
jgi:hypothetical protein